MLNGLSSVTSIKSILSPIINDAWNINLSSRSIRTEWLLFLLLLLFLGRKPSWRKWDCQPNQQTIPLYPLSSGSSKTLMDCTEATTGKLCLDRTLSSLGGLCEEVDRALEQLPTWKYSLEYYSVSTYIPWTFKWVDGVVACFILVHSLY